MPISRDMFNNSMKTWGDSKLKDNTKNKIAEATKNSFQVKDAVNTAINNSDGNSFSKVKKEVQYLSGDLHYSIQKAKVELSGNKILDKWNIKVKISDTYDFTEWRPIDSFSDLANNLGFVMQSTGLLKSYVWDVEYNFVY